MEERHRLGEFGNLKVVPEQPKRRPAFIGDTQYTVYPDQPSLTRATMEWIPAEKLERLPQRLALYTQGIRAGQASALLQQDFSVASLNAAQPEDDAAFHCIMRRLAAEDPLTFVRMLQDVADKHHEGLDMYQEVAFLTSLTISIPAANFFRSFPPFDRERALHTVFCLTFCHLSRCVSSSTTRRQSPTAFVGFLGKVLSLVQKQNSDSLDSLLSFFELRDPDTSKRFQDQLHAFILLAGDPSRTDSEPSWLLVETLCLCLCVALRLTLPPKLSPILDATFRLDTANYMTIPKAATRLELAYQVLDGFRPLLLRSNNEFVCITCGAFYFASLDDTSPLAKQFKLCSG